MNICFDCLSITEKERLNPLFSDTGRCNACGYLKDVFDLDLVGLYTGMGLSADFVWKHLPRLRSYENKTLSMEDIGLQVRLRVFEKTTQE